MKKIVILRLSAFVLLISLFTVQLFAQGGPGRGFQMTEEDIRERVDNLAETLELTDKQHKKIMENEMEFYTKMQIERQKFQNDGGPPPDREAMRETMMKMRDERNKQYEEVLTPAQMEKFTEIQEQRRNEMRRQYQENNPEGEEGEKQERGRGRG
jgi:hypothetical protein